MLFSCLLRNVRRCHSPRVFVLMTPGYSSVKQFAVKPHSDWQSRCYRAMLCKRGLCCHAVSVCPSVRLSVCHIRGSRQNE